MICHQVNFISENKSLFSGETLSPPKYPHIPFPPWPTSDERWCLKSWLCSFHSSCCCVKEFLSRLQIKIYTMLIPHFFPFPYSDYYYNFFLYNFIYPVDKFSFFLRILWQHGLTESLEAWQQILKWERHEWRADTCWEGACIWTSRLQCFACWKAEEQDPPWTHLQLVTADCEYTGQLVLNQAIPKKLHLKLSSKKNHLWY